MSTHYGCLWHVCKDVKAPNPIECEGCDNFFTYDVPDASVFRTRRKAVVESLWHRVDGGAWQRMPWLALQARLGYEPARTVMRFRRRRANGNRR
jgi:hypothetical protein